MFAPAPPKFARKLWSALWLFTPALCACVPVIVNYYQPRSGDVKSVWGGCSMAPSLVSTLHLPAHVNVEVQPIAKSPGIEAVVVIVIDVPAGTAVRLAEPTVTLRETPSEPPVTLQVDKIRKPRTVVDHQVVDYIGPADAMPGRARYGIEFDLPQPNPRELEIKPPALMIDGQRVEAEPVQFVLKRRSHLVCLT